MTGYSSLCGLKHVHFIGIGGISMSALAKLARSFGARVTGSDSGFSKQILELNEHGIKAWVGSEPELIGTPQLAVYSSAVPNTDAELTYCANAGIPVMERKDYLAGLASAFGCVIAISGTHGKTTATSMLASVFKMSDYDFCAHIGGDTLDFGNLFYSGTDYFITEACEYKKSLLSLNADISVVLNAEFDHPDTYMSESEVYDVFTDFLAKNEKGISLVNSDSPFYRARKSLMKSPFTFGRDSESFFRISDEFEYKPGYYCFFLSALGEPLADIKLPIPGRHNVDNAACAFAVAHLLKIDIRAIKRGLEEYKGVRRRFEYVGMVKGAKVISDYAHHPSEIALTIELAKKITASRLFVVFQPHTYSRTKSLICEFSEAFSLADEVFILKEYAARESYIEGGDAYSLHKAINHRRVSYYRETLTLAKKLVHTLSRGDTLLVLGAGDVDTLCDLLV